MLLGCNSALLCRQIPSLVPPSSHLLHFPVSAVQELAVERLCLSTAAVYGSPTWGGFPWLSCYGNPFRFSISDSAFSHPDRVWLLNVALRCGPCQVCAVGQSCSSAILPSPPVLPRCKKHAHLQLLPCSDSSVQPMC